MTEAIIHPIAGSIIPKIIEIPTPKNEPKNSLANPLNSRGAFQYKLINTLVIMFWRIVDITYNTPIIKPKIIPPIIESIIVFPVLFEFQPNQSIIMTSVRRSIMLKSRINSPEIGPYNLAITPNIVINIIRITHSSKGSLMVST